jgi:hypothetical protein
MTIVRAIVEVDSDDWSERDLAAAVRKRVPARWKVKGFRVTMGHKANGKANGGHHARGGIARAKLLTPAQRSAIASKAAKKRWKEHRASQ